MGILTNTENSGEPDWQPVEKESSTEVNPGCSIRNPFSLIEHTGERME
jgi:hypothetical protein